jgi:hypothetical protein
MAMSARAWSSVLAALTLSLALGDPVQAQNAQPAPVDPDVAVSLDEVVVEGRPLREFAQSFVEEMSRPARGRGLARWPDRICAGVVNLPVAYAQPMIDRISEVALEVGLEPGEPGCRPNVLVIATEDGAGMARSLVSSARRRFNLGSIQTNAGTRARQAFQTGDRAVRWWQTSMPVDSETGLRAIRLPGDIDPTTGQPAAPVINTFAASRLTTQIRDDLTHVLIIIDVDHLEGTTYPQLMDYVALVALAQIDFEGDTSGFNTIMNLFKTPSAPDGLTSWDMSYLRGLYATRSERINPASVTSAVADSVVRDRRTQQEAATE